MQVSWEALEPFAHMPVDAIYAGRARGTFTIPPISLWARRVSVAQV